MTAQQVDASSTQQDDDLRRGIRQSDTRHSAQNRRADVRFRPGPDRLFRAVDPLQLAVIASAIGDICMGHAPRFQRHRRLTQGTKVSVASIPEVSPASPLLFRVFPCINGVFERERSTRKAQRPVWTRPGDVQR